MPFVRVSRDKRGYETIYLVHTSQRRGRSAATRVLYAFRTPPGVKVGRDPFDAEVRRTLEAQNPGVEFDWDRLSNIPAPPPDVEHWRERRRAEKAAKQARKAEELEESDEADQSEVEAGPEEPTPQPAGQGVGPSAGEDQVEAAGQAAIAVGADTRLQGGGSPGPDSAMPGQSGKRRRRRRGGRRTGGAPGAQLASAVPVVSAESPPDAGDPGDGGEDVA